MLCTPLRFFSILPAELSLATVLKSGQSFRWHKFDQIHATRPDPTTTALSSSNSGVKNEVDEEDKLLLGEEFAMGWRDRTIVLRQDAHGIHYRSLFPKSASPTAYLLDLKEDTTLSFLTSYFQLGTKLIPLYDEWSEGDPHFKAKVEQGGKRLEGIRVLRQESWECLMSFICSSNNNIARITQMIHKLCVELGDPLPHPSNFYPASVDMPSSLYDAIPSTTSTYPDKLKNDPSSESPPLNLYSFPPVTSLTSPHTPELLRNLGFGYRAPFIHTSSLHLLALAAEAGVTTDEYLSGLSKEHCVGGMPEAREKLMSFMGVGRKVADCVLLFGLGYSEVVPVDTHVFQIAIRDYSFPSSKSTPLTPILHNRVASRLSSLWGPYAGWAQQILFFADLKTPASSPVKKEGGIKKETKAVKGKWEEEMEVLFNNPDMKRSRVQVKQESVLKVEVEEEYSGLAESVYAEATVTKKRRLSKKVKVKVEVKEEIDT